VKKRIDAVKIGVKDRQTDGYLVTDRQTSIDSQSDITTLTSTDPQKQTDRGTYKHQHTDRHTDSLRKVHLLPYLVWISITCRGRGDTQTKQRERS
jgi:hypothetical protein